MTLGSAGVILLTCLASVGSAPQGSGARGGSLVTIDFRALTPDGQPVLDLKPADVALKIDGRAREIRSLDVIQTTAGSPSPLPPPYASNNASDAGREIMLDNSQ